MNDYQPNELLTVAQICEQYGVGKTTLYEVLGSGALQAKIIGKRGTRIRRQDVDNWIQSLPAYKSPNREQIEEGRRHP